MQKGLKEKKLDFLFTAAFSFTLNCKRRLTKQSISSLLLQIGGGGLVQPRNGRNYNAQPLLSLRLSLSFHSSARRKKKIKKIYETAKRGKKWRNETFITTLLHFLARFLFLLRRFFLLSLHTHSDAIVISAFFRPSQSIDSIHSERNCSRWPKRVFFFPKTRVQTCSHSDNRTRVTHRRGHLRYRVVAQTQFASLGTTRSSEESFTRQWLQRRGQELDGGFFIKNNLHCFSFFSCSFYGV